MTHLRPVPILRSNPKRLHRDLLLSTRLDVPPQQGKRRTLAALGLSGALIATTSAAASVAPSGVLAAGTLGASSVSFSVGASVLKGVAIGALFGGALYGTIVGVGDPLAAAADTTETPVTSSTREVATFTGARSPNEKAEAPVERREPKGATAATVNTTRSGPPQETDRLPRPPPQTSSPKAPEQTMPVAARSRVPAAAVKDERLSAEVSALAAVRRWLALNEPARAIGALQAYRAQFGHPRLLPEAESLRVQALFASGQKAQAIALGQDLLARYPNLPEGRHLRTLLRL